MSTPFWNRLLSDRGARERWEAAVVWFRLRYLDDAGPERCIRLLSLPQACGRVALYHLPDEAISRLYIGVPIEQIELLQRMSADLNFSITAAPDLQTPPSSPLAPVDQLPWDRAFYAHVVEGYVFVTAGEEGATPGSYLPVAPKGKKAPGERFLLQPPPVGLSMKPSWNGRHAPAERPATTASASGWPIGQSRDGTSMFAGDRVNLYGSGDAVAGWLARLVEHLLREKPRGLIVLDGKGDLVPALKRKAAVTRLLGKELTYVDIDGATVAGGLNPLAPVPGESEAETLQRWQRWFGDMGVHQDGLQLLSQGMTDGVNDVTSLQRWLQQPAQQHFAAAVSSLQAALRKLQADPTLREWLSWPTNVFAALPEGALFLTCQDAGWGRQQLLVAVGLAAAALAETRLVLHGFPWAASGTAAADVAKERQVLVSNGPLLRRSTIVLTHAGPDAASKLARRFLSNDTLGEENLQLLREGEGMLVHRQASTFTSWRIGKTAIPKVAKGH